MKIVKQMEAFFEKDWKRSEREAFHDEVQGAVQEALKDAVASAAMDEGTGSAGKDK